MGYDNLEKPFARSKIKGELILNIIIAGCGKVGRTLAQRLSDENHSVTVIDARDEVLSRVSEALDVMCIKGSATSLSVLEEADAAHADVLVAATNADEINMLCCHCARRLGTRYTAARVRSTEYFGDMTTLKSELGIDLVINPEYATAVEISRLLRFPSAANIDAFRRGEVELVGFVTQSGDFLNDLALSDLPPALRALPVLFCAVERGEDFFIPDGRFQIRQGDKVYVIGEPDSINRFFKLLGRDTQKVRSAFIVGGGRIGHYLTGLLTASGIRVKLVERGEERCRQLAEAFPKSLIINGDGTDPDLLAAEHLSGSDAFVALTDRDEDNLIISLYALQSGVSKVVAKSNRENYFGIARSAGLQSLVSPRLTTANVILKTVRGMQNKKGSVMTSLHRIANGHAEAAEFIVSRATRNLGVPLKDLRLKRGVLIALISRDGEIIIPEGSTTIEAGDSIYIVSHGEGIMDVNDIYEAGFGGRDEA